MEEITKLAIFCIDVDSLGKHNAILTVLREKLKAHTYHDAEINM